VSLVIDLFTLAGRTTSSDGRSRLTVFDTLTQTTSDFQLGHCAL